MSPKRSLFRKDLRIAVRFRVAAETAQGEKIPNCLARDLSGGGMLLSCPRAPRLGSRLRLEFKPSQSFPRISVVGSVKRVHPSLSFAEDSCYVVAIGFEGLSPTSSRALRRHVMDRAMELVETLREFPAFAKLSEFDQMVLAGVCHRVLLPEGEVLVRQGDEASAVFVVRFGKIKLCGNALKPGNEAVEVAGPGQIFGEVSTITGLPHDLDITALEDSELIALTRDGLHFLKERHPETALALMDIFMRFAGMRMRRLTRKLFTPLTMK